MKFLLIILLMLVNFYSIGCNKDEKQDQSVKEQPTEQSNKAVENAEPEKKVIFKINGKPYYKEDVRNMKAQAAIQDAVIYEAALLDGKDKDPEFIKQIERYKRNILIGREKGEIIKNHIKNFNISEEELEKYYQENKLRYSTLDLLKVSTPDKETSDKIHQELKNGKSIDEIKTEYDVTVSEIGTSKKYNRHFNELKTSDFTEPIFEHKSYNIYIIKDFDTQELKVVKRMLSHQLINETKQEALKEYVNNAKKEKNIKVEIIK